MRFYRPGLPTEQVMAGLRDAIHRSDQASVHVVLWLSEIIERDLHRERGCLSPHQFVRDRCGFSESRTTQVLRLARIAATMPVVRDALAAGRLGWTSLRVLAPVLTTSNAPRWVAIASRTSRRALERRIAAARERSRETVRVATGVPVQLRVPAMPGSQSSAEADRGDRDRIGGGPTDPHPGADVGSTTDPASGGCACSGGTLPVDDDAPPPVPVTVTLRFEPVQLARLEALVDVLRRRGHRGSREEVFLAALELAVEGGEAGRGEGGEGSEDDDGGKGGDDAERGADETRGRNRCPETPRRATDGSRSTRSRYQIVIAECPGCRRKRVAASDRPLDPVTSEAVACDADRVDERGRRRSVIPPSVRRRVLARDGHRCRAPGCGRRTLLEIHHRVPVSRGGSDEPSNLVTLCHGCHQALHAMASPDAARKAAPGCGSEPPSVEGGVGATG